MTNVVIVSAARTAVGSFNGSFANTPAHELGAAVIEAVVARAGIDKAEVSETILGQVLTGGQGQNPARQAAIRAGLPVEASAWGINQVCGSGLRAVALGAQHVQLGDAAIVVAGQALGTISDPLSEEEETVVSPISGTVLGMAMDQVVMPGFAAYHIGYEERPLVPNLASETAAPETMVPSDPEGLDLEERPE